jgi:uracil-DNA glycosylase family 4
VAIEKEKYMENLLKEIRNCSVCAKYLPTGVNPVISASTQSRIIIIGQAPGSIVHRTGIPWNDKSGDRLRSWLQVDKTIFYNNNNFALMPMGFCYPGKGKSGDLPPRTECAPLWHQRLLEKMKKASLTILIGQYAQQYYLPIQPKITLTETVKNFQTYLPAFLPLPHPSPRNNIWQAKNPWFDLEVIPELQKLVKQIL